MGNENENLCSGNNNIIDKDLNSRNNIQIENSKYIYLKLNKKINRTELIRRVILLQKYVRAYLAIKKYKDKIELLTNILNLDTSINLIKDNNLKQALLNNNKGEMLYQKLLAEKKILNFENTVYYKTNIRKYKPDKLLLYTDLTFIDKYKNKNMYIGTWTLEKIFNGFGVFYISGNKYEGFWNFGKLNGLCRYFLQNNDYFIGSFIDGKAEGKGRYYHNDGTLYEGEWEDDQPNGTGKEMFNDGSVFEGTFKKGDKTEGKFSWVDGSYYKGQIFNNLFEGNGEFHWSKGREYKGEWKKGKMNGFGKMKYLDGSIYEGNFRNGKREGYGIYTWNQNKYYKGNWLKGKLNGNGSFYHNGKIINAIWKNGKIETNLSTENDTNNNSTSDFPRSTLSHLSFQEDLVIEGEDSSLENKSKNESMKKLSISNDNINKEKCIVIKHNSDKARKSSNNKLKNNITEINNSIDKKSCKNIQKNIVHQTNLYKNLEKPIKNLNLLKSKNNF